MAEVLDFDLLKAERKKKIITQALDKCFGRVEELLGDIITQLDDLGLKTNRNVLAAERSERFSPHKPSVRARVPRSMQPFHNYHDYEYASNPRGWHGYQQLSYQQNRIPILDGSENDIELFEWIAAANQFFDYYGIRDDGIQFDRVVCRLRSRISLWWDVLQQQRLQDGKDPIFSWRRMKKLLMDKFQSANDKFLINGSDFGDSNVRDYEIFRDDKFKASQQQSSRKEEKESMVLQETNNYIRAESVSECLHDSSSDVLFTARDGVEADLEMFVDTIVGTDFDKSTIVQSRKVDVVFEILKDVKDIELIETTKNEIEDFVDFESAELEVFEKSIQQPSILPLNDNGHTLEYHQLMSKLVPWGIVPKLECVGSLVWFIKQELRLKHLSSRSSSFEVKENDAGIIKDALRHVRGLAMCIKTRPQRKPPWTRTMQIWTSQISRSNQLEDELCISGIE